MTLQTHGDQKYNAGSLVGRAAEWEALRVEHRRVSPGRQQCVRPACTEFLHILSGHAHVRRIGNGQRQEGLALPGTSWLVPAGTEETLLELDGPAECLIVFLPAEVLEGSALAEFGLDPARSSLAYAAAIADPALSHLGAGFRSLLGRAGAPPDRLFAEGLKVALSAHLVGHYRRESWRPAERDRTLDPIRLRRVFDLIEDRLSEPLSLEDLAGAACLSPFHFSRLFQKTTGRPPHRYLMERRIAAARTFLAETRRPLAEVALDAGFGSQANFTRTFRKASGLTPGEYRALHARRMPDAARAKATSAANTASARKTGDSLAL
ncbi:helix-turn-helix domain-containing protein [Methylobrevis albus]|uniref:Helix-turn-helix transcriptional regulator n=1 Tax=Methylobrevis albus TaxID=2793297 RepID=A0A931I2V6_9HYPH|nr:helix-turn-helix domain-containing protein [Methylobrevis albus]MBH0237906.1 helix-turn-helix transcriptional regulator [Methylobrevis albus]